MLLEIGSLASIVKTLLDSVQAGVALFGGRREPKEAVSRLQQRISGISDQLYQSVSLSKMLPIWLREHNEINLYQAAFTDAEIPPLESKLRRLVHESIHDYFSGTFFRLSFASLPDIDAKIGDFRQRLTDLEQQLNGVPPGDLESWRRAWPVIRVRLDDLRKEAVKLNNAADEIHAKLVHELRDAANAKPK